MKILLASIAMLSLMSCTASQSDSTADTAIVESTSETSEVQGSDFADVEPAEFASKIKSSPGTILDVRTPEEVAEGKIEGAVAMNFYEDNFEASLKDLDKTKPVYVYCAAGGRSAKASSLLKSKGFIEVYNLDGGMTAWLDEGMPIVK